MGNQRPWQTRLDQFTRLQIITAVEQIGGRRLATIPQRPHHGLLDSFFFSRFKCLLFAFLIQFLIGLDRRHFGIHRRLVFTPTFQLLRMTKWQAPLARAQPVVLVEGTLENRPQPEVIRLRHRIELVRMAFGTM